MSQNLAVTLTNLSLAQLVDFMASLGEPAYRARQVYRWLYRALADDFSAMHNLPAALRSRLAAVAHLGALQPLTTLTAADGLTRKVLFRLADGNTIESVLMLYAPGSDSRARRTVCVSTQAGCALDCAFCATGKGGLIRNLTAGEIVEQVLYFARQFPSSLRAQRSNLSHGATVRLLRHYAPTQKLGSIDCHSERSEESRPTGEEMLRCAQHDIMPVSALKNDAAASLGTRNDPKSDFARALHGPDAESEVPSADSSPITNVIFAGMGEPLANYAATWAAVERLNDPAGFGLGARHMTISTAGLVPGIRRLAGEKLQVNLAVSLHAPDDVLRPQLMPIARHYPLAALLAACREYSDKTGRRVSFEYLLIDGVNSSPAQARQLAALLEGMLCHVNLIPLNPIAESPWRPPSHEVVLAFERELARRGIATTRRSERGVEIQAACGQLRAQQSVEAKTPAYSVKGWRGEVAVLASQSMVGP
jgi:23S rRNA (adenine2503-C2)-methyltransferase